MLPLLPSFTISPWLPNSLHSALSSLQGVVWMVLSAQRFPWNFFPLPDFLSTHVGFLQPGLNPLLGHHMEHLLLRWLWCVLPLLFVTYFSSSLAMSCALPFFTQALPVGKAELWAQLCPVLACLEPSLSSIRWSQPLLTEATWQPVLCQPLGICTHCSLQKKRQNAVTCFCSSSQINAELYKLCVNQWLVCQTSTGWLVFLSDGLKDRFLCVYPPCLLSCASFRWPAESTQWPAKKWNRKNLHCLNQSLGCFWLVCISS